MLEQLLSLSAVTLSRITDPIEFMAQLADLRVKCLSFALQPFALDTEHVALLLGVAHLFLTLGQLFLEVLMLVVLLDVLLVRARGGLLAL